MAHLLGRKYVSTRASDPFCHACRDRKDDKALSRSKQGPNTRVYNLGIEEWRYYSNVNCQFCILVLECFWVQAQLLNYIKYDWHQDFEGFQIEVRLHEHGDKPMKVDIISPRYGPDTERDRYIGNLWHDKAWIIYANTNGEIRSEIRSSLILT